ncbi:MAG: VWA domain-containing protein [Candidatus Acidiferrales bacterium]|nr:VWA domain-containing protein [Acidobacteriota bacterium]
MKQTSIIVLCLLMAGGIVCARAQEQQPPPPPQQAPPIRVEVDLVNIVFSVTNRRGRHTIGLGPDDFTVFENGEKQEIKYFSSETNLPLRIGMLIDTSNSVRPRFQFEQEAAVDFLHTVLRPKTDQAFVIGFDAEPVMIQDLTDDPIDLAEAIRSLRAGGGTSLYDAVYLAAKMKMANGSGDNFRKMLIVLSDGDDTSSYVSREEALEMARRHDVTIFTVSTSAPPIQYSGKSMELQNPCSVMGGQGDKTLRRFAKATGGISYCPFNTIDVGRSFQRISTELRNQYTIAYTPTNRVRDGSFRRIEIKTRRKKLNVHHRPGYYASPVEAAASPSPSGN